jgi:predicted ATPase/DNA-binding CsgD family transcriptional regulator
LVTLTGPGGVGKTRLALEVAADLAEDFAGGASFVDLSAVRDRDLVVPAVAQVLGVRQRPGWPLCDALADALHDQALLLVLDNLEQVAAAAPDVAALVAACPGLTVLATSRTPLRVRAEYEYPVSPLALPEGHTIAEADATASAAVSLFVARAQAVVPGFALTDANAPAISEVCRRLDGLPLAIELAAPRLKVLSPEALLGRLTNRLTLLTDGAPDQPERLRTIRATIAWSHDLLSPEEQALFRRLAVFAGGFTLEAAETVAPAAGHLDLAVLDGVASLVDQSLLRRTDAPGGEPRFGMLETVREFALERLETSGEADASREQHAAWSAALAERADDASLSAEERSWFDRIEAELDNLRAALAWAIGCGDAEAALRLASAPWSFWAVRRFLGEGHSWLARALALPNGEPSAARAKAMAAAGMVAWARGEVEHAENLLQQSAALWRSIGDGARLARSLHYLGLVAWQQGDFRAMAAQAEASLAAAEESGDEVGTAVARVTLGRALLRLGELGRARQALERALERFRALGIGRGTAWALAHLVEIAQLEDDRRQAIELHLDALNAYRDLADTWGVGEEVPALAALAAASGRLETGARLLGAGARLRDMTGIAPKHRLSDPAGVAADLKERLGEGSFAAAWEAGRALTTEQAVAEAEAIAKELVGEERPPLPPAGRPGLPAGLSEREAEVLGLVAARLTNAEAAERLYLSPRTVEAHLRRIYDKLGTSSRAAAVRFALDHDLA